MFKAHILCLLLFLRIAQPAWAGCCGSWGCGGLPAAHNLTHGKMVRVSGLSEIKRQHITQTRLINQYMKLGSQLELKKKWVQAQACFKYVLQVIAIRDGIGSFNSIPALEHLAIICRAQNQLQDAISYQQTALDLTKAQPKATHDAVLNAQLRMVDTLLQAKKYSDAAEMLDNSVTMYRAEPSLSPDKRLLTYRCYANVLRYLHKDSEAGAIESEINSPTPSISDKQMESNSTAVSVSDTTNVNRESASAQTPLALNPDNTVKKIDNTVISSLKPSN